MREGHEGVIGVVGSGVVEIGVETREERRDEEVGVGALEISLS